MKKMISLLLALCLVFSAILPAQAAELHMSEEDIAVVALADGGSLTIIKVEYSTLASNTITGSTSYIRRGSSGQTLWTATLSGSFTYNGSSATCTASSLSFSMSDSHYYVVSSTPSKNGNTAVGDFTIGYKILGVTYSTESYTITLSCDKDGNLS